MLWDLQGSNHVGPQPLLVATKTSLFGQSLSLNVDRVVAGEQSLQGSFPLGYAGQLTRRMPWDASVQLVWAHVHPVHSAPPTLA